MSLQAKINRSVYVKARAQGWQPQESWYWSSTRATETGERLPDDSARFITQAAFYFNHINEAFNLAACFTSRRCVAYLGCVVDEDFSALPREPLSLSLLTPSFFPFLRATSSPAPPPHSHPPSDVPRPFTFIHLSVIIFLFSHPPAVSANNRTSFRPRLHLYDRVARVLYLTPPGHAPLR